MPIESTSDISPIIKNGDEDGRNDAYVVSPFVNLLMINNSKYQEMDAETTGMLVSNIDALVQRASQLQPIEDDTISQEYR